MAKGGSTRAPVVASSSNIINGAARVHAAELDGQRVPSPTTSATRLVGEKANVGSMKKEDEDAKSTRRRKKRLQVFMFVECKPDNVKGKKQSQIDLQ